MSKRLLRLVLAVSLPLMVCSCGTIPLRAYLMKGRVPTEELGIPAYDEARERVRAQVDSLIKERENEEDGLHKAGSGYLPEV